MNMNLAGRRSLYSLLRLRDLREKQASSYRAASKDNDKLTQRLQELIKTSNDDIDRTRVELFAFLGALAFIAVTIFGITDAALLTGSSAKLPILDVMIGLDGFLVGSPILILAIHYALLLKFSKLSAKCRIIDKQLLALNQSDPKAAENLGLLVGTSFLAQWLVGGIHDRFNRWLNFVIYFIALICAPILVLLLVAVRTLPLHQDVFTDLQVGLLTADAWLLAYFHLESKLRASFAAGALWVCIGLVICVPDSRFDRLGAWLWPASVPFGEPGSNASRKAFWPTAFLLESRLDEAKRRPIFFFSRNLIVRDDRALIKRSDLPQRSSETKAADSTAEQPEILATISLRGRDLRYAVFDRTDLRGADFTLSDLSGASLQGTDLRGAVFGCTRSQLRLVEPSGEHSEQLDGWPSAVCTKLASTNFSSADLRNTLINDFGLLKPSLEGVKLSYAKLDGVDLSYVSLDRADLFFASLVGTNLRYASLVGSTLAAADLSGADLSSADISLSDMNRTSLDGANMAAARIIGTNLTEASMIGADLTEADLTASRIRKVRMWQTGIPKKEGIAWADVADLRQWSAAEYELKRTISVLKGLGERHSSAIARLDGAIRNNAADTAYSETWRDWARRLGRSTDDNDYQRAIALILSRVGCEFSHYALAIERWLQPDYGGFLYQFERSKLPLLPEDPLLKTLSEPSDGEWTDFGRYTYPEVRNPIPNWADVGPLLNSLKTGTCNALKKLPPDFIGRFEEITNIRSSTGRSGLK